MELPLIARVRRTFNQPEAADVAAEVARAVAASALVSRAGAGARIAVAVGSRGIAELPRIVRATVDSVRSLGLSPFVVAAMGSHGGGTAEGQRALLAELGVTERSAGCPIRCGMETVVLGTDSSGSPIHFGRDAFDADGIVLVNRIKPHTSFRGRYESGLLKMLAVGLGKREGAARVHKLGLPGLDRMIPEVGAFLLDRTPVALGLAILENAADRVARVAAVEPEEILDVEPQLLEEARGLMPGLPFDQLDVLLVGELGKNYSGVGMDPAVIGRLKVETTPDHPRPVVTRLAVLDVAPESRGNALGIGFADLTTERLVRAIDPTPMRVNAFTSNFLARGRIPLAMPTDRDVLAACLDTCWRADPAEARMAIIPNTLELTTLWATRPLAGEIERAPDLAFETDFRPIPLDPSGTLDQELLFPESLRARRRRAPGPAIERPGAKRDFPF